MKYLSVILVIFFLPTARVNGQQIMVETGKSITSFDFNDVQSVALSNLQSTTQGYISFGYRHKLVKETLFLVAGGSVNSYGAKGSDNSQNYYAWETTYLGFNAGLDVKVAELGNMLLTLRITASPEFIIQGTQTLNNQVFNIVGEEDFDKVNLFLRAGAMVEYSLTYTTSLFAQYKYGQSTQLRSPSLNDVQGKLKLQAHDIGFGLLIKLDPKNARKFRQKARKANMRK